MKMKIKMIAAATAILALAGCSSTPDRAEVIQYQLEAEQIKADAAQDKAEKQLASIPDWVLNPPKSDATGVYGVGIGESRKLNVSIKKASLNAQFELAKGFGQELAGNEKSYTKDGSAGSVDDYTQLIDSIVSTVPINGYETVDSKVAVMDGKYTSYKLLRLTYEQFEKGMNAAKIATTDQKIKGEFNDLYERLDKLKVSR